MLKYMHLQVIKAILSILASVEQIAQDTPPVDNAKSRFGNPAFKEFYDQLVSRSPTLHAQIPGLQADQIENIEVYFTQAWGSRERIDYGSGMELNFLCWILCLNKLGLVQQEDFKAVVIKVFWKYMQVMRTLQSSYWLEPAGQSISC